MGVHHIKGKHFVAVEPGEALAMSPHLSSKLTLDNGQSLQVQRYYSTTAIATGASDTNVIPAPASDQFYLVVIGMTLMCDATTLVTWRSNETTIGMPLPVAANGGITRPPLGLPLLVGVPGQGIDITTSGGNTYVDLHYVQVPIDVDVL